MLKTTKVVALGVLLVCFSAFAAPKGEPAMKEEKPGLSSQAKISPDAARKTALAKVAGGIQSQELEQESGKLVYSFDIKAPHKPGVEEVQVDAVTGEIVSVKHENAKQEAQEKKTEPGSTK